MQEEGKSVLIKKKWYSDDGFTIVELLIVIVVIGILAGVTLVTYNGVSNRANDTTIQSDLSNFAKQVQLIHAETGNYPEGGAKKTSATATGTGNSMDFPGFTVRVSKGAYSMTHQSLHYCQGSVDGQAAFRVAARSKSGQSYEYTSMTGSVRSLGNVNLWNYTSQWLSCQGMDYPWSYASGNAAGVWRSWVED